MSTKKGNNLFLNGRLTQTEAKVNNVDEKVNNVDERLSQMSQSQCKVKEYVFEKITANKWMHLAIDESNAFIDGSSYFVRDIGTGIENMLVNGMGNQCAIVYSKDGLTQKEIQFNSVYAGILHAFIRYK